MGLGARKLDERAVNAGQASSLMAEALDFDSGAETHDLTASNVANLLAASADTVALPLTAVRPISDQPTVVYSLEEARDLIEASEACAEFKLGEEISDLRGRVFQIVEKLWIGGMASIYSALHIATAGRIEANQRLFAVKLCKEVDYVDRFQDEIDRGKMMGSLSSMLFLVEIEGIRGRAAKVMELVAGEVNVLELITEKNLRAFDVGEIGFKIALALVECHLNGMIHRDVKPANVLVDWEGDNYAEEYQVGGAYQSYGKLVKLVDFGVSADFEDKEGRVDDGLFVGTPMYFAPEILTHQRYGVKSDLFALGVTLYNMLSGGKFPYFEEAEISGEMKSEGNRIFKMSQCYKQGELRELPSGVPEGLREICYKLLAINPDDRYEDALGVAEALDKWMREEKDRVGMALDAAFC